MIRAAGDIDVQQRDVMRARQPRIITTAANERRYVECLTVKQLDRQWIRAMERELKGNASSFRDG